MRPFIIFFCLFIIPVISIQAQTYPVDSCIYFMDPYNFRIQSTTLLSSDYQRNVTQFRSSGSPDLFIMGKGVFLHFPDSLPVALNPGDRGEMLLSVPESSGSSENWPGGQPPFPLFLPGFLVKVEGTAIDPPLPITMRVGQLFYENTTE